MSDLIDIKISKKNIDYLESIKFMEKKVQNILTKNEKEMIWFLNHDHIYTCGTSSNKNEILSKSNIPIIKTNRGGKITYHGPGQRVVYLMINLNKRKKDIRRWINTIENSIIEFLFTYKIEGKKDKKNIGIWVNDKKIAAIGLRVSKWIAYHGCSININNNLNQYLKIIPCGLDNQKITSLYNESGVAVKNIEKKLENIFMKNINKI